jgi:hypothetical protein
MPFGKDGKFNINPHQVKSRDGAMGKHEAMGGKEHVKEAPAHSHHIYKTPAGHHSSTHHHDGSVTHMDHGSYDEAAQHGKEAMHEDGHEPAEQVNQSAEEEAEQEAY